VIGEDRALILSKLPELLGHIDHTISPANASATGKYVSINIDAFVHNEEERLSLLPLLRSIPKVKIVI
jgi:putative lipoic acid-binding regulatory protein